MKRAKWQAALLGTILRLANSQSGQAWAEYSLIIALVAVTAVTALAVLIVGYLVFLHYSRVFGEEV